MNEKQTKIITPTAEQNLDGEQNKIAPAPHISNSSIIEQSANKPKKHRTLKTILLIFLLIASAITLFYTIIRKPLTSQKVYLSQSSQRVEATNYLKKLSANLQPSNLQTTNNYLVDFGCEGQAGYSGGLGEPGGSGPIMSCNLGLLSFFQTNNNVNKNISDLANKLSKSDLNIGTVNMAPLFGSNSSDGINENGYNGNFASVSPYNRPSVRSGKVFDNIKRSYNMADFTNFFTGSYSLEQKNFGFTSNNPDSNSKLYYFINNAISKNTNNDYGYYLIYQYYMADKICNQINVACKSDTFPLPLPLPQKF